MSESSPSLSPKKSFFSNVQYNTLKHVAAVGLPALAALYFALGQIWNLPHVSDVMATIATVNTVLGGLLGYSTATYNNSEAKYAGVIEVTQGALKKLFSLNLNGSPEDLEKMAEATFKVESSVGTSTTEGTSTTNSTTTTKSTSTTDTSSGTGSPVSGVTPLPPSH